MFYLYTGKTANDIWRKIAEQLLNDAVRVSSRSGDTNELLHTFIHIENPTERWVSSRFPTISIGFALADLIWILSGSNDSNVINYWNPILPKFSGNSSQYHGAYGYRLRHHFDFDQIERAYYSLKNNPDTRQTVMIIWDPKNDFPDEYGKSKSEDIPCNICSLLKIRDNRLEWTQVMRSNDLYRGLPYNLIQFTSIQEIMAGWLQIDVGSYCHYSDSMHLYHNDLDKMKILSDSLPANNDSLFSEREEFYIIIRQIYNNMSEIAGGNLSEQELFEKSEIDTSNSAYQNIMYIIALYAADKMNYENLAKELLKKCTNKLYIKLWKKWRGDRDGR